MGSLFKFCLRWNIDLKIRHVINTDKRWTRGSNFIFTLTSIDMSYKHFIPEADLANPNFDKLEKELLYRLNSAIKSHKKHTL